ncbi:MAG: hypothetical protein FJ134_15670 [Deltaproteobacteria bacterium]|nr:hypothetical protein [Deltaproteobacteria bacterium]
MVTIDLKNPEALEAERLFNHFCNPKSPHWKYPPAKQAALAMLRSGIFGDNVLKGHARHRTTYQVVLAALIYELENVYSGYINPPPISFLKEDILCEFDRHFSYVAAIAQLAGVRKDVVENWPKEWREKISNAADNGRISPDWRWGIEIMIFGGRCRPQKLGYVFADIFLSHCLSAPPSRIADWVNAILKSLDQKPLSKSSLSDYVKKRQEEEKERITAAGENYHTHQKKGIQIRY